MTMLSHGFLQCVRLLINNNAYVDFVDDENETALTYAASFGHGDCVHLLLDANANVNQRNNKQESAFI